MVIHKPIMLHEDPDHREEQIEEIRQVVIGGIV
jgi:hypothetical protein